MLIRMDAADILEAAGFRTYEASDVDEALKILCEHHASIVLLFTDVEMPGPMNGFGLARAVAEQWPHIGILIASGRYKPGPDDLPGGAHFVGKPFSADVVHDRLRELLPDGMQPEPLKR
ncbi:response regulator [Methylobacterium sp. C25]|nr:response regulator [Methylobacterium sp. C25]